MKQKSILLSLLTLLILFAGVSVSFALPNGSAGFDCNNCHYMNQADTTGADGTLTAVPIKANKAPNLDGNVDSIWSNATTLTIPVGWGWAGDINVSLKALYTPTRIYFLAQWTDSTFSDRRQPYIKQSNGSWTKLPAKPEGTGWTTGEGADEQLVTSPPAGAAYEDKFAMIWNIDNSIKGFNDFGCAVLCHATEDKTDWIDPHPKKYTNGENEKGDMWHWKLVRTGPIGQVDDQYVDNETPTVSKNAGRHSDPKTGGGYSNIETTGTPARPEWTGSGQPVTDNPDQLDPYFIKDSEKTELTSAAASAMPVGSEHASILISPFTGDRGDISAQVETATVGYDPATNTWTLEFSRKLETGSDKDVQFSDLTKEYFFGIAVFNNAQIEHSFNKGVYKLVFQARTPSFNDTSGHWAEANIELLSDLGIVSGFPDKSFRPNNSVTRAEFLKIVMEALDIPQDTPATPSFTDIKTTDWFYGYVEGAVKAGIISGFPDNTFRPNKAVTRAEASKILVIALGKEGEATSRSESEQNSILSAFTDQASILSWARPYVAQAVQDSIFQGFPDSTFRPNNSITRAEAATVVARVID